MSDQAEALTVSMPVVEVVRRLKARTAQESVSGAIFGERSGLAYVGSFDGTAFRIRVRRSMPQFYATYLFGQIDEKGPESLITFRFSHRRAARWALWVIRVIGALLVVGALMAGLRQPVFFVGAAFVAAGTGILLWAYRQRADDRERLRKLLITSTQSAGPEM